MPTVSLAGADFTVSVASADHSAQVTTGTVTTTSTITRTRTLGPGNAFTQTDLISAVSLTFLYDDDSGLYDALNTAAIAGTSVAVTITGGGGTWTGSAMYVESADTSFDATGVASCTTSLTGEITFA
jgi:hypothetical protein